MAGNDSGGIDMERAQREEARWRILRALDAGRPRGVPESVLLRVLQDVNLQLTPHELRRELQYLESRELIYIEDMESSNWLPELTRYGIDVVEYTIPCEAGIARPKKR